MVCTHLSKSEGRSMRGWRLLSHIRSRRSSWVSTRVSSASPPNTCMVHTSMNVFVYEDGEILAMLSTSLDLTSAGPPSAPPPPPSSPAPLCYRLRPVSASAFRKAQPPARPSRSSSRGDSCGECAARRLPRSPPLPPPPRQQIQQSQQRQCPISSPPGGATHLPLSVADSQAAPYPLLPPHLATLGVYRSVPAVPPPST